MVVTAQQVIENHLHVGGLTKETNPKTRKFWIATSDGQVIFDPEKIAVQLENAKQKYVAAIQAGKQVLIVCEKSLYTQELADLGQKAKIPLFELQSSWLIPYKLRNVD
jgi:ribosomal protein S2